MWMKLSIDVLDTKEWDWKLNGSTFTPDLEALPENLLTFGIYKCKNTHVELIFSYTVEVFCSMWRLQGRKLL